MAHSIIRRMGTWLRRDAGGAARNATVRDRITHLPLLVAMSIAVITTIGILFDSENARLLGRIENSNYPVLQLDQEAEALGLSVQQKLQDVAATADTTLLAEADRLNGEMLARLAKARGLSCDDPGSMTAIAEVEAGRRRYYPLARRVAVELSRGIGGADNVAAIDSMTTRYNQLHAGWDPLESTCRHASLSIL